MNDKEKEYRCAYKEVVTILDAFSEEVGNLIPSDKIEFYKSNMDVDYKFEFDYTKEILDQNILYPKRCILANLFRDYIATEEDRAEILKEEREEIRQLEEEKRKKYNPDDVFKNSPKSKVETTKIHVEEIDTRTELIVQDKNIGVFEKIKNKIINFLNKILNKNNN